MNRRESMKFLGKAIVAIPLIIVGRLPKKVIDNPDVPIEFVDIEPYVRGCNSGSMHGGLTSETIANWNGDTWGELGSPNTQVNQLFIDADGILRTSGEFTSP